jgi:regulator of protease activity HflC (stomatin/prohibitin superfamily)
MAKETKGLTKRFLIGCGVLFVGAICVVFFIAQNYLRSLFVTIGPDERGVVISPFETTGYLEEPLTPGNNMIKPGERVEIYKLSRETYSSSSDTNCCNDDPGAVVIETKDGSTIIANYRIVYIIDPKQVIRLHINWQHRYQNQFIIPQSKLIVEEISSKYAAEEIALSKKEEIEKSIFNELESVFSEEGFFLFEFKFEDINLK